jgi:PTH1 family peptidyl-tRNA hydrolase
LSRRNGLTLGTKKFNGRLGTGIIEGRKVAILLPRTYMNRSGRSVAAAMSFYKIEEKDLIVIHDDVDLELGRIVVKEGGGTAGHKGLRSIVAETGKKDFIRIRFGIGRPENPRIEVSDFVLGRFASDEQPLVADRMVTAAEAVETILVEGVVNAANKYNVRDFH